MVNKIYTLWKLKEGYDIHFGEFNTDMLGAIFEEDYSFNSLEIGGAGLNGTYVITQKNRIRPIIIFTTRSHGSGNNSQEERARTRKGDSTNIISDPPTPENSLAINGVGTPDKHSQNTGDKNNG